MDELSKAFEDKIDYLISLPRAFTAYDVTISLRNDGHHVKHSEIRKLVHKFYDDGFMGPHYTSELRDFGSYKSVLFYNVVDGYDVYKPICKTYTDTDTDTDTDDDTDTSSTDIRKRNKQPKEDHLYNAKLTSDGRLNIPVKLVRKANFLKSVDIHLVNNELHLMNGSNNKGAVTTVCNTGWDLRVPAHCIKMLNKDEFTVKVEDGIIIVE
jgi:hypothetical protein